ncbi:MAG: undecaprenyldiphospho-muramoylpentapeptide beta-N-acetylglucosaminyltransferase [Candidatus Omnitrophica bacterium CG11_big_fil_rev_8_21_14_0_20_41_12]|nr:MAG: undecaprenyldiphospho-muramoylpentapeptide beta-N-acetylglucosaminyltransferase [Candidatus Omnitrophica bacterium CG11_big_fil_rev_8_21_14_0_20_41_12]
MRILIVTGSSGGHIYPALALIDSLKDSANDLLLVLPKKNQDSFIVVEAVQVKYIPASNLSYNLNSKNIKGVFLFLSGAWESLRIVIKFRPEVVVGFGSLNTVALVFWAWLFRIKTIIHEQNVIPGRANRLLAKLVDRVAVSFSQTKKYLNISAKKIIFTGNPLRQDLIRIDRKKALDFLGFTDGKFNILITGGSQGSHRLNTVCSEAVSISQKKDNFQIIHITGTGDFLALQKKYRALNLTSKVFEFFLTMQYAYSVADLIICRAGATTVAELQRFAIPAILIPYPFAYAHQKANACVLQDLKAALIIKDEELTAENLTDRLDDLLMNPDKLKAMRKAYGQQISTDAAFLLAKEVLNLK